VVVHLLEEVVDFREEIAGSKLVIAKAPGLSGNFFIGDVVLVKEIEDFGRASVNEFGAEFDGIVIGIVAGEDASANTVAGFEDSYGEAGAGEFNGGGEAGGTGSEDENVGHRFSML
jgi:hypothetical protein